ncbi:FKBP-type peptidyl-prolyl cis-trans isomerase [Acaryochloris marina]|uniref:Peptidyl-prolyl cis-trans isomerase n=1 Tax=Acaryochloris marina (strain MBIC 11017) TaxID=329726 RepID=B0C6R8_ACAM1|nr:peptidylprolyl isomerase [Acaryochloris marina]ABW27624.1 peptidyl-prolyl cis-trans isomerase, FKBP-type [Acaryochloris marina MBIC11017]BDM82358.1 peptidyl-prolyl cis-trans isomerase [Acaryochloris marina MBIC10699]
MAAAKVGDTVSIHYTGKLDDGSVFDSSLEREPLKFSIGGQQVIPGFEQAVIGMNPGESKTETIVCDQAYGPRHEDMVVTVLREQIPSDFDLEVGQQLQIRNPEGQVIPVMVSEIIEDQVTLDGNHPLAGEDLTFEIELVSIA